MCIQGKQNLQEGCLVMVGRLSACNGLEVFCQIHYQQDSEAVIVSHAFGLQETTLFTRDLDAYWGRHTQKATTTYPGADCRRPSTARRLLNCPTDYLEKEFEATTGAHGCRQFS